MPLDPGDRLGPYEILAPLGAGAMGQVYEARDPRLDRVVAIKVLSEDWSGPDRFRRFEQEARAAGTLNHANVLTVHDFGTHGGQPYIVTELLVGRTLRETMAGSALPAEQALDLATQIARGLTAAHAKGIVHRDLKPENVFVTHEGVAKILDFGLARITAPEGPIGEDGTTVTHGLQTRAGTVMGTLGYMSPEQVRGETVDARSDIFSLGVMLYEMVSGSRPFVGQSSADTISAILTRDPPSLSGVGADIDPALDSCVRGCLAKSRDERVRTAEQLSATLQDLSRRGAGAAPAPVRGNARWWVGGCAALALIAIALWAWWDGPIVTSDPTSNIRSLAVLPLENLSGDPGLEYFSDGMTEALTTTLGQIEALRVISRTSVMRFKDSDKSAPEIADELGVDVLVEGSVLISDNRVRIAAQLIDGTTDAHLWADSYERELERVLSLQSDVARRIAEQIGANLTPAEMTRLSRRRDVNPEAYDAYLRGTWAAYADTPESADAVVDNLRKAIDLDPEFAPAYARLADFFGFLSMRGRADPAESYLEARRLAARAVELDPDLAEAHAVLARILYQYEWDWANAAREFEIALKLNPNDVETLLLFGSYQVLILGQCEEGLGTHERVEERAPFDYMPFFSFGVYAHHCRRYEESIRHIERAIELKPGLPLVEQFLAWNYSRLGRHDEALAVCRELLAGLGTGFDPMLLTNCVTANALAGQVEEARKLRDRLTHPPDGIEIDSSWDAFACAALGDETCVVEGLERAYRERSSNMVFLRMAPLVDAVRENPRFQALIERMGFPP